MQTHITLKLECDCKGFNEHLEPYAMMEWVEGNIESTIYECPDCKRVVKLSHIFERTNRGDA